MSDGPGGILERYETGTKRMCRLSQVQESHVGTTGKPGCAFLGYSAKYSTQQATQTDVVTGPVSVFPFPANSIIMNRTESFKVLGSVIELRDLL